MGTRPWGQSTGIGWLLAVIVLLAALAAAASLITPPGWFVWALVALLALAIII